jgi:nicotinamidase-related amidase
MSKPFSFTPEKSALLVMDFQNTLVNHYIPADQAANMLARTADLLAAVRMTRMHVIYVMVAFRAGHPEVSPRNKLFSMVKQNDLFVHGGADTAIHSAVAPTSEEPIVVKHRVGAFSGTDLETLLRPRHINTLVLAGITTSGVVLSTVRQAFDLDYRVVVARDCCADSDPDVHRVLLENVFEPHADVVESYDLITALRVSNE